MAIAIELVEAGDVMLVVVGGDLTFPNVPHVREKLLEAFAAKRQVGLEIREVREVDLSFLQVLCAAYRTALAESKEITLLNRELPAALRKTAAAAGFAQKTGCPDSCGCWFTGRA